MKNMRLLYICLFLLYGMYSCNQTLEKQIDSTFVMAEDNRAELEYVLKYYSTIVPHAKKLEASKFLIANMRFHNSLVNINNKDTPLLDSLTNIADSLLFNHITSSSNENLNIEDLRIVQNNMKHKFSAELDSLSSENSHSFKLQNKYDCKVLTASFIINHIDHVFEKWEVLPSKDKPSFDDFCEYVLPYRAISGYPLMDNVEEYSNLMDKYMTGIPKDSITLLVERYNFVINELRNFFPTYPYNDRIGYQELFFHGFHECTAIAHFGASILRSQAIPIAVEYNSAYKLWRGRHYHCSVQDSLDDWLTFSPESGLPQYRNKNFEGCLNIYRFMFSEQKNTPFFLRGKNEFIPIQLRSPFIKDVTSEIMSVSSVSLPIKINNSNKLAYLASFSSELNQGIIPVTWGKINKILGRVAFKNVIPNSLYFPIYYNESGECQSFGNPFFVNMFGNIEEIKNTETDMLIDIIVTRKFPLKTNLAEKTKQLIGTVIIAANNPDFAPRDTIATISDQLEPNFQDIALDMSNGPYQYYRIQTTNEYPYANIAEVQFLTDTSYNYINVIDPTPLPILHPLNKNISSLIRLLDEPLEKILWKSEYDGNALTAPSAYPTINYSLQEPQFVNVLRIMPLHADNGINIGDQYQLLYWNENKWENAGLQVAEYNFLQYNIPPNRLYLLKNLSKGKEESPFTINDQGQQKFLYTVE